MSNKKRRPAKQKKTTTVTEDGGRSPGTYEDTETNTDRPRRRRRGSGGPFLEPAPPGGPYLEGEGRRPDDVGGPFNEPGTEDMVLFAVGGVKGRKKKNKKK